MYRAFIFIKNSYNKEKMVLSLTPNNPYRKNRKSFNLINDFFS